MLIAICGALLGVPPMAAAAEASVAAGPPAQVQLGSVASPGVRLLIIGGGTLRVLDSAPVIRLGPPQAFADLDARAGGNDPLTCLAQAIYFEARSESTEGQEAVAQVVINRSRHPNYPPTVCGVVFEGYERSTGCQFSFVCDGSLREPDDYAAWDRARAIAKQALAGFVYKPVVEATHYHASWMTPYWEAHMTRIRQIGGHVFFR